MDVHGGNTSAVAQIDPESSSYAHRDKLFLIQFYDRVGANAQYPENGFSFLNDWVVKTVQSLPDEEWGMYINYADTELDRETAQSVYWMDNTPRLQKLKAQLDPTELFYYPLSIDPKLTNSTSTLSRKMDG